MELVPWFVFFSSSSSILVNRIWTGLSTFWWKDLEELGWWILVVC